MTDKKLIVVAGPTAVGKTAVATRLATEFDTAVVSADSRQLFREMTIGTAKPTAAEMGNVPHYFVGNLSVTNNYDAATYAVDALSVIRKLFEDRENVILCGGSGLYIRALCEGFDEMPQIPVEVRQAIIREYEAHGLTWLQREMEARDPETLLAIDRNNPHRLIRALEVKLHSGKSILSFRKNKKTTHDFDIVKIGLHLPKELLYQRINERVDRMIAEGLFEEVKSLFPLRHHNALQTVGYQEIFEYMDNRYDLEECVRLLKRNSRRYAKRQLTWFKKDTEFTWFNPHETDAIINHIRISEHH